MRCLQDYLQTDYTGAAPVDGSDEALLALADGELALPAGQIEPEQRAYLLAEKAAALAEQYGELSKEELLQVCVCVWGGWLSVYAAFCCAGLLWCKGKCCMQAAAAACGAGACPTALPAGDNRLPIDLHMR